MYQEHDDLSLERAATYPLWRYMDLWKFLKLINRSKLFFSNLEKFGDQNEGKVPKQFYKWMVEQDKLNGRNDDFPKYYKEYMDKHTSNKALANSWSAIEIESFALWKMYAKDKLGIAIKTDIYRLINSFKRSTETIFIGDVNYFDLRKRNYKLGSQISNFVNKNKFYEFEKEVRCLILLDNDENVSSKSVEVDLNVLIKEVYLSPFAVETGLLEVIEFLRDKHNLNFTINKSNINDTWL